MKIWVQSGSGLTRDAGTVGFEYGRYYEESLRRHLQKVARPGSTVDVRGVDGSPVGKDRYYASQHLVLTSMIRSVLRAEPEGYDVVAVSNTIDPGPREIREVVDVPVVFITESSLYVACLLAPRFAFVAHSRPLLRRVTDLAASYGVAGRMADGGCLDLGYDDFPRMYNDPEPYLRRFHEEAARTVARGADILLPVSNALNLFLVDQGVRQAAGVPVLDVCGTLIKVAEMMVDLRQLGVDRSRNGLLAAPSKAELAQLRKLYGAG